VPTQKTASKEAVFFCYVKNFNSVYFCAAV